MSALEVPPKERKQAWNFCTFPQGFWGRKETAPEPYIPLNDDEEKVYQNGVITFGKLIKPTFWCRKSWIKHYLLLLFILVFVGLSIFFHSDILKWLTPFTNKLYNLHIRKFRVGWIIAVLIIFVLSIPPLLGNEVVLVLVGLVWGLGEGMGIAAAGTILGEAAAFLLYRKACRENAKKYGEASVTKGCLVKALQDGGTRMAIVMRLSVIPSHLITVALAACDAMKFYKYLISLVLTLPKQLLGVYVGVVLAEKKSSHIVSDCVFAATAVVSLFAMWYIYRGMLKVRRKVVAERRGLPDPVKVSWFQWLRCWSGGKERKKEKKDDPA